MLFKNKSDFLINFIFRRYKKMERLGLDQHAAADDDDDNNVWQINTRRRFMQNTCIDFSSSKSLFSL